MKELGEAINESLADSEQIADVVSRIKDGGYDIFLVLEATIGVSRPGEKSSDKTSMVTTLTSNPDLKVSEQDLKFLKSLRIKIEDDAATGVIRNYRIVYPDAVNGIAFSAFVKAFKRNTIAVDSVLRAVVTFRGTGAVTRL